MGSMDTMTPLIVLVPAPVLGPATWKPVAAELSRAGHRVAVPSLAGFDAGDRPYAPRLIRLCAEQVTAAREAADEVVLVVHSGAGPFAEHLATAIDSDRITVIFADASLPRRSRKWPVVDAAFLPYLREIARDGVVPAWPEWWPGADDCELFPNEAAREAVVTDARPLPLAFFEETLAPLSSSPARSDHGYLLFSEGYRDEADAARRNGWPVAELPGSHLHMLVSPAQVATAVLALTDAATVG
jgi:Alpha/beta hydrolase family